MESVLIVVPVYNHAASLAAVLQDLTALPHKVLVVDDGSTDAALPIAESYPEVALLRHDANEGKGAAIATGMRYAAEHGYSAVLTFDADGQHLAAAVAPMLAAHRQNPAAMIIGCRDFAAAKSGDVPGSSKFGRQFSNAWIWLETGQWLPDTQSGLRLYPVDLKLLARIRGRRYAFEIEVITRSLWRGRRVISVAVPVHYPPRGERISHFHGWHDNLRLSQTHALMCVLRVLSLFRLNNVALHQAKVKFRANHEVRGMGLAAWAIQHLGPRFAYSMSFFPVVSSFLWRHQERRALNDFYKRCRSHWGPLQRALAVLHNYALFAASIIDRTRPDGEALVEEVAEEKLRAITRSSERGLLLLGAHYGDWLLIARKLAPFLPGPIGLVLDAQVTPEFFAALAAELPGRIKIIAPNPDGLAFALTVKELLDARGMVCFLADRVPATLAPALLEQAFLGAPRQWLKAPFALAARLMVPVWFVSATKDRLAPSAKYRVNIQQLWAGEGRGDEREILRRFALHLEQVVASRPQHWFNFFFFWEAPEQPQITADSAFYSHVAAHHAD